MNVVVRLVEQMLIAVTLGSVYESTDAMNPYLPVYVSCKLRLPNDSTKPLRLGETMCDFAALSMIVPQLAV